MSKEEKDPITQGSNSSDASTQPEGLGIEPSSPSNPSGGNEERIKELEGKVEEISNKYSASSTEGKRLKSLLDEAKETLDEKEDYIKTLEQAIESEEEKEDEEKKKPVLKETTPPVPEKSSEKKPNVIPPHLTKEGQKRALKELLDEQKKQDEEVKRQYDDALSKYPSLKNKSFSRLVSSKMRAEKLGILDACKSVDEDLKALNTEEEEEPFIESGQGKTAPHKTESAEDKIRQSLKKTPYESNLPGFF